MNNIIAPAPQKRSRSAAKKQNADLAVRPGLKVAEEKEKLTIKKEVKGVEYQVSIAYTQPRRYRPAMTAEERKLCEFLVRIHTLCQTNIPCSMEVVGYSGASGEKPYFSGAGFFVQCAPADKFIAWRMGVYETFCLGIYSRHALLALIRNMLENAKTRIK